MTHASQTLRQILVKIEEFQRQGRSSLAVFDLDSTLFDVGPRLEKILLDFAEVPEHQKLFPEQIVHFRKIRVERRDWGIREALVRAGLDGHHPEFQEAVRAFWVKHFFSNEYLEADLPYPGAVEYVQKLHQLGAEIVYLTGRDVARMGPGSAAVLQKWNFPLGDKARLELKPHREMDDAEFKTNWFLQNTPGPHAGIWFFENEPVNIHHLRLEAHHVEIVYFDSTHSRRAKPPEDLPQILHFLLEGDDSSQKGR